MTSIMYLQSPLGWTIRTVEGIHNCSETFEPFEHLPDAVRTHIQPETTAVIVMANMDHITPLPASDACVLNVCGRIMLHPRVTAHPAWLKTSRQFGMLWEAFTLEGNICIRYEQVAFKGATDMPKLASVVSEMFSQPGGLTMQIAVLTSRLGKAIFIQRNCLLECALRRVGWASVMSRLEELCNVVLFQVADWGAMQRALGMDPWEQAPTSATVSISRRGVLTFRLTWKEEGTPWAHNRDILDATDRVTEFVRQLV